MAYNPIIDNYCLSIPETEEELWRNELQLLYDTMKLSVPDVIAIDGQYFDVHDEYSDEHSDRFHLTEGEVIVGARKIAFAGMLPAYFRNHKRFFDLTQRLKPGEINGEQRRGIALKIAEVYKNLIEGIKSAYEFGEGRIEEIMAGIPDEFGLRSILRPYIEGELEEPCFRFPHFSPSMPTTNYAAALGSYHLHKDRIADLEADSLIFIPADEETNSKFWVGPYRGRLRFTLNSLNRIDLLQARDKRMFELLRKGQ